MPHIFRSFKYFSFARVCAIIKKPNQKIIFQHKRLYVQLYCKKDMPKLFGHENINEFFSNVFGS